MTRFSMFLVLATILIADVSAHAFYNSATGRWLSRDPIEERGGKNLFAMCRNRSLNAYDYLGREEDGASEENPTIVEGDVMNGSIDGDAVQATVSIAFTPKTANNPCYAQQLIMVVEMKTTGIAGETDKQDTTFSCNGQNALGTWEGNSDSSVECKLPVNQCPDGKVQGQFTFEASYKSKLMARAVLKWDYTCGNCCELKDGINHHNTWFIWDPVIVSGK